MSNNLQGRTILVTRSPSQAGDFTRLLTAQGARVLEVPTIEIRPRPEKEIDAILDSLTEYDWVIFTSVTGAEVLLGRARRLGISVLDEAETGPEVCAIGPATADRVREYGGRVDLVPSRYQAEGVLESFLERNSQPLSGLKILIPRASRARSILPRRLRELEAKVDVLPVYDTIVPPGSREKLSLVLRKQDPDLVTFTSSSTVRHFVSLAEDPQELKGHRCAVMGPITAETAEEYGLQVVVQARKSTILALLEAIVCYFNESEAAGLT